MEKRFFPCFQRKIPRTFHQSLLIYLLVFLLGGQIFIPPQAAWAQSTFTSSGGLAEVSYSISGATLGRPTQDAEERSGYFHYKRTYEGQLGTGTLIVEGTAKTEASNRDSTLTVTVHAGGPSEPVRESFPSGSQKNFRVAVPITQDSASFSITVTHVRYFETHGGTRYEMVTVSGNLSKPEFPGPDSPTDPSPDPADPPSDPGEPRIIITNCPGRLAVGETKRIDVELHKIPSPVGVIPQTYPSLYIIEGEEFLALSSSMDQVIGRKPGRAVLGAFYYYDAGKKVEDTCVIEVYDPGVKGIRIDPGELVMSPRVIEDGGQLSASVSALIDPPDAEYKNVFWTSSHPELVRVEAQGDGARAQVIAYAPTPENVPGLDTSRGRVIDVTVTATTENGGQQALLPVKVQFVPVVEVWIETNAPASLSGSYRFLEGGRQAEMWAVVLPKGATDKTLNWTSTNPGLGELYAGDKPGYKGFRAHGGVAGITYIIARSASNPRIADHFEMQVRFAPPPDISTPSDPFIQHPPLSEADMQVVERKTHQDEMRDELIQSEIDLIRFTKDRILENFPLIDIPMWVDVIQDLIIKGEPLAAVKRLMMSLLGKLKHPVNYIIWAITGNEKWFEDTISHLSTYGDERREWLRNPPADTPMRTEYTQQGIEIWLLDEAEGRWYLQQIITPRDHGY